MASINTKQYDGIKPMLSPDSSAVAVAVVDIDFPSTTFTNNDLIRLAPLEAGVSLVDYAFVMPDVDDGTAFAWSFGELNAGATDLATVYASGITTGQATGVYRAVNAAHLASDATTDRRLAIKVTTTAGTYTGSTKKAIALLSLRA
jgi:hypothetical protein